MYQVVNVCATGGCADVACVWCDGRRVHVLRLENSTDQVATHARVTCAAGLENRLYLQGFREKRALQLAV